MITERDGDKITITLDAPWEKEVLDWVWRTYGPNYIKKLLSNMLLSKEKSMVYHRLREQSESELGARRNDDSRVSSAGR